MTQKKRTPAIKNKIMVGCLEMCDLPDIGIHDLKVRVDTGAKTSSLHVDNMKQIKVEGKPWISFDIHPDIYSVENIIKCRSPLHDVRRIKSSNGASEERFVILTTLKMGDKAWPIEITLTNRSDMSNLMLLGREGMRGRIIVDPSKRFLLNHNK